MIETGDLDDVPKFTYLLRAVVYPTAYEWQCGRIFYPGDPAMSRTAPQKECWGPHEPSEIKSSQF